MLYFNLLIQHIKYILKPFCVSSALQK